MVRWMLAYTVTGALAGAAIVQAEVIFTDDFDDGVADGWVEFPFPPEVPAAYDASSGAYRISLPAVPGGATGIAILLASSAPEFRHGYFRSRVVRE